MKFFLIFVALNASNPQEPAVLGHNLYNSLAECQQAGISISQLAQQTDPRIRTAAFCVAADEFKAD